MKAFSRISISLFKLQQPQFQSVACILRWPWPTGEPVWIWGSGPQVSVEGSPSRHSPLLRGSHSLTTKPSSSPSDGLAVPPGLWPSSLEADGDKGDKWGTHFMASSLWMRSRHSSCLPQLKISGAFPFSFYCSLHCCYFPLFHLCFNYTAAWRTHTPPAPEAVLCVLSERMCSHIGGKQAEISSSPAVPGRREVSRDPILPHPVLLPLHVRSGPAGRGYSIWRWNFLCYPDPACEVLSR